MIKLIITDMDGTLLNNNHEIDNEFWKLLEKLKKLNVIFAIASGRPYYNLYEKFKSTDTDLLFIAENGGLAMYKNQELFSTKISKENIILIKNTCDSLKGVIPVYCSKESAYIEEKYLNNNLQIIESEIKKYYNHLEIVKDITLIDKSLIKIAVCDPLGSEKNSYPILKQYENILQVVLSGKVWTDISKIGTNKGVAIREIQNKLDISFDETMAFGDYLNDISMLKEAKYSYAMKNSHPELFKVANFITKNDNDNLGVVKTIEDILSLKSS